MYRGSCSKLASLCLCRSRSTRSSAAALAAASPVRVNVVWYDEEILEEFDSLGGGYVKVLRMSLGEADNGCWKGLESGSSLSPDSSPSPDSSHYNTACF